MFNYFKGPIVVLFFTLFSVFLYAKQYEKNAPSHLEVGGVIMFDVVTFDGVYNQSSMASDSELRRVRLNIKSQKRNNWWSKLSVNLNDEESNSEIKNAFIEYELRNNLNMRVGRFKEPFGFQNNIGSKDLIAMERSSVTEVFSPGRNYGLALSNDSKKISWQGGIFKVAENHEERDTYGLTGRVTYDPIYTKSQWFHLGLSASLRDLGAKEYEIEDRAELHSANNVVNTSKVNADSLNVFAMESAWVYEGHSIQAEYFQQRVQLNDSEANASHAYWGGYIQTSSLFSNDIRRFKKAPFGRVKIKRQKGSWEWVARYSVFHGKEDNVTSSTSLIGVNYYVNKEVRVMANVLHTFAKASHNETGNGLSLRIQHVF